MFVLSTISHIVEIAPNVLGEDFVPTLVGKINKQFANYVIPDVGLCITFYDFKKIGDSFILPGNASTHTPIIFRYVVFQPFINEILEGIISQSNRDGLTLTLHFFNDIKVAPDKLPDISKFDEKVQIWYWEYQNDDTVTQFYMDPGRRVRFKVVSVKYHSLEPGTSSDSTSAMTIEASMLDMGLGCVDWWDPAVSDEVKQEMNENEEQTES
ncbi:unnamed protein product [Meloidogyne enterolobii]|uniref:Uncharacterized protein n=1 Tax=Meloidogyne enterolobii TaxID=390850 RepID=A0ACB0ZN25_MELEN